MKRIDKNHSFAPMIAMALKNNVCKAILLKEIFGWVEKNEDKNHNIRGGIAWTYMSSRAYANHFQYMKEGSIDRWLRDLEREGWIVSGVFNKNAYDRTKWYTINQSRYNDTILGKPHTQKQIEEWKTQFKVSIPQIEESIRQNKEPIPTPNTPPSTSQKNKEGKNGENEGKGQDIPPTHTPSPKTKSCAKNKKVEELDEGLEVIAKIEGYKTTIRGWVALHPQQLQIMKDTAYFRGNWESELDGFVRHYEEDGNFRLKPVKFFCKKFVTWLKNSKTYSPQPKRKKGRLDRHIPHPRNQDRNTFS